MATHLLYDTIYRENGVAFSSTFLFNDARFAVITKRENVFQQNSGKGQKEKGKEVQQWNRAIFLDRDGVVNVKLPEDHYVRDLSEFTFLPEAIQALCILKSLGYLLVIVTNQRGIARGFMTEGDLERVHGFMMNVLEQEGAPLDGIYHCPHDTMELCMCRKPRSGMIYNACDELRINPAHSFMVGDSPADIAAGKTAGTRTVRIGTGNDPEADFTFPSLMDFARYLQSGQRQAEWASDPALETPDGVQNGKE